MASLNATFRHLVFAKGIASKTVQRKVSTIEREDPIPSQNIIKKKRTAQTLGAFSVAKPSGYTMKTRPEPLK